MALPAPTGWYFGKTAGLWGTMNNEPSDDLLTSTKTKLTTSNIDSFTKSWQLDKECAAPKKQIVISRKATKEVKALCESFFSKVSSFVTCFPRVPNKPFFDMCLKSVTEKEACTSALAYMHVCHYENTPLRIPDACVK